MTTPRVSVVMSVYNGERYLQPALDSVLEQQGVDFEVIAVDDGSTDSTPAILDRYAGRDSRLRILHQANEGLTRALIRGCAEARGEFIARQDADDLSLPGRLAKQVTLLDGDSTLAMVSCTVGCMGPAGERLYDRAGRTDPVQATRDLVDNFSGPIHGSVMFRRAVYLQVGGYRPEFYFAQDSDLWLRIGDVGRIAYVPDRLYLLRISEGGLGSRWGAAQARLGELSHVCQSARREGQSEAAALAEARTIRPGLVPRGTGDAQGADGLWFLSRCLLSKGDRRGLKYAVRYIACRPGDPKGWLSAGWGLIRAWYRGETYGA